jgi:hypothetical protein
MVPVGSLAIADRTTTRGASSSIAARVPEPSPCRRKLIEPAAAPSTSAPRKSRPRLHPAARAPIIVSPQPSRYPRGSDGGTTSNGCSSAGTTRIGASARFPPARSTRTRTRGHGGAPRGTRRGRERSHEPHVPALDDRDRDPKPRVSRSSPTVPNGLIGGCAGTADSTP